ncbi:MAG: ankyrin repeat domain-containing protein [Rickettsiales bacterium]|nr:ankyrin repeat domain-containing protein [Rickettsiales bacterium]
MTINIIQLVENKDIEEIENFIAEGGDVNFQDKDGWRHNWTALDEAVYEAEDEIVELLVKAGAKGRRTNLIEASRFGRRKILKLLIGAIEEKEDLNIQDCDGQTALINAYHCHVFSLDKRAEIIEILIKAGADRSIKDNKGKTALDYAKEERDRHQKIVELLEWDK